MHFSTLCIKIDDTKKFLLLKSGSIRVLQLIYYCLFSNIPPLLCRSWNFVGQIICVLKYVIRCIFSVLYTKDCRWFRLSSAPAWVLGYIWKFLTTRKLISQKLYHPKNSFFKIKEDEEGYNSDQAIPGDNFDMCRTNKISYVISHTCPMGWYPECY